MVVKKKIDGKFIAKQKRSKRRILTFFRVIRYGSDSFFRNSWLSVAATAVMTITLLIIFIAFSAHTILTDTVGELRNKVDMSIYLKTETTVKDSTNIIAELNKLSSVKKVTFISAADARAKIATDNSDNADVLAAINEATNKTPATIRVVISDINDTSELQKFVENNKVLKPFLNPDFKPSFAGERRNTIQSIGRAVNFAQQMGIIIGAVFVIISSLIIFNTIRMAIFNRKEEIQMMKLIGANQSFIRGPFLVESMIYGFIAAIISTGLGIWGLYSASDTLSSYQITIQPTIDFVTIYAVFVLMGMIIIGAIIGVISSIFATQRYLKL